MVIATLILMIVFLILGWQLGRRHPAPEPAASAQASTSNTLRPKMAADLEPTLVYAHNLLLQKGPDFRIYISWIRGQMRRTQANVNPSFDEPDSFVFEIQKGVIRANIGDISHFLNANAPGNAPLKNITIEPDGDQLVLHGNVHKIISLPIELRGTLGSTPDGLVQFHLTKLDVLKLPLKRLLGGLHVQLDDLVHTSDMPGITIAGNDIFFDTQKLLPPPHIHGRLTSVRVLVPDIEVVYGGANVDETRLAQWHNFLKLSGGTIDFGKLTMHNVDLIMIDASTDPWFDLDLVNYQAQLVNGYTRMTPQAGLEIFMPDLDEQAAHNKANKTIGKEWLKNRNQTLPSDIPVR
jgi:hypothetical protein